MLKDFGTSSLEVEKELDAITQSSLFKMKLKELRLVRKYSGNTQHFKVSVIMPTWNRAFILPRAIDSVLRQTYSNFELLISDDGSDDNTKELIEGYIRKDPRIKYLGNKHGGVSKARNSALARSTGECIAYLDSDNEWSENYLLVMVNSLEENKDLDAVYSGLKIKDNINMLSFIRLKEFDWELLRKRNFIDINIFVHRRSLFEQLKGFDEDLTSLEDWDLILKYTRNNTPLVREICMATYYFERNLNHLSFEENLMANYTEIRSRYS